LQVFWCENVARKGAKTQRKLAMDFVLQVFWCENVARKGAKAQRKTMSLCCAGLRILSLGVKFRELHVYLAKNHKDE
ncbi:MAG: hypothetical protein KKD31_00430, partial [Bacteroidetes bacterium]|nr:hypothetical protein [Bacteroidota bacterium]